MYRVFNEYGTSKTAVGFGDRTHDNKPKTVIRTPREVTSERCYTGIGFVTVRCSVFDSVKKKKNKNCVLVPFPVPVPVFFISVPCNRALEYLSVFC